jgi:molybdopterin converting factor small subunit
MPGEKVKVTVRFLTIMQKYSGDKREVEVEVPREPFLAIEHIIKKFRIPWKDHLEKSTRIFINKEYPDIFVEKGKRLEQGDIIVFIPISGGG